MPLFCTQCGTAVAPEARFCPQCGNALPPSTESATPAPAAAPLTTTTNPYLSAGAPTVHYGGFWIRFLAVMIDAILVSAVVYPVTFIMAIGVAGAGYAVRMPEMGIHLVAGIGGFVFSLVGNWIYEAYMLSSERQATIGKIVFRLRVTDLEGQRISFGKATARHFAKYLSSLTLLIGYIMAAFTERHQALHDILVGTLVRQD